MVRDKVAKKSGVSMPEVEFSSVFPIDSRSLAHFRPAKPIISARSSLHCHSCGTGSPALKISDHGW
jgi:hypothetical protein